MSNNLDLDQVSAHQAQAEVTINDKGGQLDAAITEVITIPIDNTNAYTLTASELRRHVAFFFEDDGTPPTADSTVTVPGSIERGVFVVVNNLTTYNISVEISGQTEPSVDLAPGEAFACHSDGINVRSIGGGGALNLPGGVADNFVGIDGSELLVDSGIAYSTALIYDIAGFFAGTPANGELITRVVVARTVEMPTSLTGSRGWVQTTPTAQTDFDLQQNGSSIGTMRFAAAANTATFIFASPVTLSPGDRFSIVGPNPADATAANLSFAIKCTRTD